MELDDGDLIVDIGRVSPGGLERNEKVRVVKGNVHRYDPVQRLVTLRLRDGTSKSYHMKDAAATRMNDVRRGTHVTLELDPKNNLAEDFKIH